MLGLVGKGITFDTGGISIKPADGMERMKELTRRLLAVPKTELDKIRAKEQAPKKKGKK